MSACKVLYRRQRTFLRRKTSKTKAESRIFDFLCFLFDKFGFFVLNLKGHSLVLCEKTRYLLDFSNAKKTSPMFVPATKPTVSPNQNI